MNEYLINLADKYETEGFLKGDPSWFMHQVEGTENQELMAFIASSLSYGSRKQFMPKILLLLNSVRREAEGDVGRWLAEGMFSAVVPLSDECFYRLYTCRTFRAFLARLAEMVREFGSIKGYLKARIKTSTALEAVELITEWFRPSIVIPKDTTSSCKRVCMFLRWMVRDNSPVDLGLWADIIDRRTLIIPMDTHVVQEATRLGLLNCKSASMSAALRLTDRLKEIFPDDPLKGDFALFGVGVDQG